MKLIAILLVVMTLTGCARKDLEQGPEYTSQEQVRKNRLTYAKEIREATKECLSSVRGNPRTQNFNDDNEIVETCTEYGMKVYNACYGMNGAC
ncbi:hypothetical protein [Acinetobacter baumannii]